MLYGALLGALTSVAVTALFFLGQQLAGLPFVPFDLFDQLSRALPGGFITLFIDTMVKAIRGLNLGETDAVAKLIEQFIATGMAILIGAIFGAVIAWLAQRERWSGSWVGTAGGFLLFIPVAVVESSKGFRTDPILAVLWMGVALVAWGTILGGWIERTMLGRGEERLGAGYDPGRRAFLARTVGGSLALALGVFGLGRLLEQGRLSARADRPPGGTVGADRPLSVAGAPTPTPLGLASPPHAGAAPGTRAEVTSNEAFYRIDIDVAPPVIDGDSWGLDVEGLFDKPRRLSLAEIMAMPAETRPYTYSCISNPVGGDLIGNAFWTGVRAPDLMKDLGLKPEAKGVRIVADDGFVEFVTREDLEDPRTLFVYGMNGKTLYVEHGFPLRIQIPNRYGMKQPKWITRLVAVDKEELGYWVVRGWSKQARPQITSVIDTVAKDQAQDGRIPIGGIAWAGDRGISKVEVLVDKGPWQEATLLAPALGPLTWVQWRYDWPSSAGRHTFRVRATDGTGALQIEQESDTHPDGATGFHSVTETI